MSIKNTIMKNESHLQIHENIRFVHIVYQNVCICQYIICGI